jgi:L-ascorbate metabolism protein UlaG (beta-lactamase superfamily)
VRPGLSPAELGDVELILLSHQSPDHLDPGTLRTLPRSATVIVPPRTAQLVSSFGFARVIELGLEQSVEHRGVDVTAVEVLHGSRREPAAAYVLRGDGPSIFFCGTSGYFEGFARVGQRFHPDIALLPIGGYAPASFRKQHMSPLDALYAFEDLRAKMMIPIRHGAFALSYEQLSEPERWLAELVAERELHDFVLPLEPGQSRIFVRPRSRRTPAARGTRPPDSKAADSKAV